MLGLTLREEFRGKRLKGTAIELSNESNTGATQWLTTSGDPQNRCAQAGANVAVR